MFAQRAATIALISLVAAGAGSCGGKKEGVKATSGLAARVADYRITEEAAQRRFEELSAEQRKEFKGPEGKAKFVDRIIEEHLIYRAAIDAKMDREEEVAERVRWVTINMLVAEYFKRNFADKVKIADAEIETYYREHPDEFRQPPVLRAQLLVSADSLKAASWRARIVAGEQMTRIANKESEHRETGDDGGDLGYFNVGGYVKGVGQSKVFDAVVEKLEAGNLSDVFRFELGYGLVRLTEKNVEKVQTLDEARRAIAAKLQIAKTEELYNKEIERLRKRYPAENYLRTKLASTKRTAAELWERAQMESDPRARIQLYRDIVNQYPNEKSAPDALFMIGFTYAEDLKDIVFARRTFDELIRTYPTSEIVESAKWMLENMSSPGVKIDSPEDVKQRAEENAASSGKGR